MNNKKVSTGLKIIFLFSLLLVTGASFSPTDSGKDYFETVSGKGESAPGFTLKDQAGNIVSLEDFKGKVVYMDIWASWCTPCIMQMNKSKYLKEHFSEEEDLVFLYISIDHDIVKWKQFIEKREVGGVHLISPKGEESNILEKYNVPSIPRFILIDKEGNISDFHAKPPSNKSLIKDIQKLLS